VYRYTMCCVPCLPATSGLYGIMIALLRCAKVDIYGFHVTAAHGALYHYYDSCDTPAGRGIVEGLGLRV